MEVDGGGTEHHLLPLESIRMMAESVGISGLGEEPCKRLTEDLEYRLKEVVQNAIKFSRHGKRRKLTCSDIDNALKLKNVEPLYGFECAEYIPLRHTSGGGKDYYFRDDQEIDLVDLISSPLPKLPCDVSLRAHWLAVEGVQPSTPENVPPASLEEQKNQATAVTLTSRPEMVHSRDIKLDRKRKKEKEDSPGNGEWTKLKPLQTHGLSLEQQIYYKEITDACIGISDSKRQEALTSLSTDPGLYQLLPQLISFIIEGVKVNLAHHKLVMLRHLLRMVKALLENTSTSLEKYLHDIIPAITSCLLNRQICLRPESEDHWSVRDQAAKILAVMCKKYSNAVNNIQSRLSRILSQALNNNTRGLAVHYAAVMAFVEMGQESVSALVIPRLKQEGELIKMVQLNTNQVKVAEQIAANKLQNTLQKHCAPSLLQVRSASDTAQVYQNEYGYLGLGLFNQVKALRQGRQTVSALALHAAGQKIASPTLRSPTSPLPLTKNKPPPLAIPVTATKISVNPRGSNLSSPTQLAAALRVVTQAAATSQSSSSPVVSIPASILSAVVKNPSVAQAVLASQLSISSDSSPTTPTLISSQESTESTGSDQSSASSARRSSTSSN